MSLRIGMLGLSEGNGHPFSFSAIINGYSDADLAQAGWPVIHRYVCQRDAAEFGLGDARVTHAWTQDPAVTARLCSACRIDRAVERPEAMLGEVDAIILARDDYAQHLTMARQFLEAGLPVFIDKPLTVEARELAVFLPYLESGQLMSCSGMRFARELDAPRAAWREYGEMRLIRGAVVNDWEKYAIHLIDAVLNLTPARPVEVTALPAQHSSVAVTMDDGSLLELDALGAVARCFRLDLFGTQQISSHDIGDNFSMFRRLLFHFVRSVRERRPVVPVADTLSSLKLLIAGRRALAERRKVSLNEIQI